jgi:hypothetical protein
LKKLFPFKLFSSRKLNLKIQSYNNTLRFFLVLSQKRKDRYFKIFKLSFLDEKELELKKILLQSCFFCDIRINFAQKTSIFFEETNSLLEIEYDRNKINSVDFPKSVKSEKSLKLLKTLNVAIYFIHTVILFSAKMAEIRSKAFKKQFKFDQHFWPILYAKIGRNVSKPVEFHPN